MSERLMMERLRGLARRVLEALPPEPNGLSKHELAEGLLGHRDPRAYGRVCRALAEVEAVLGDLYVRRGHVEDMGLYGVELYGVPAHKMPSVRAFLRCAKVEAAK